MRPPSQSSTYWCAPQSGLFGFGASISPSAASSATTISDRRDIAARCTLSPRTRHRPGKRSFPRTASSTRLMSITLRSGDGVPVICRPPKDRPCGVSCPWSPGPFSGSGGRTPGRRATPVFSVGSKSALRANFASAHTAQIGQRVVICSLAAARTILNQQACASDNFVFFS